MDKDWKKGNNMYAYIRISSWTKNLVKKWSNCREHSQSSPKTETQDPVILAFGNLHVVQGK